MISVSNVNSHPPKFGASCIKFQDLLSNNCIKLYRILKFTLIILANKISNCNNCSPIWLQWAKFSGSMTRLKNRSHSSTLGQESIISAKNEVCIWFWTRRPGTRVALCVSREVCLENFGSRQSGSDTRQHWNNFFYHYLAALDWSLLLCPTPSSNVFAAYDLVVESRVNWHVHLMSFWRLFPCDLKSREIWRFLSWFQVPVSSVKMQSRGTPGLQKVSKPVEYTHHSNSIIERKRFSQKHAWV